MPARADLDPTEIPSLLPHIILTDVLGDSRYRFRLVGTEVERSFGAPMTGRTLEQLMFGDYLVYVTSLYDHLVETREPLFTASRYASAEGPSALFTERVALPLSSDGAGVDMVLSAQVFRRASEFDDATAYRLQHSFVSRKVEAAASDRRAGPGPRVAARRAATRLG